MRGELDHTSGKVDRGTLPQPAAAHYERPTEAEIIAIISELFKFAEVSPEGNFLRLGGTSLTAMQLVSRILDKFGIELELDLLFNTDTTVHDLSIRITELYQEAYGEQA
jgi:acyl carrier protein